MQIVIIVLTLLVQVVKCKLTRLLQKVISIDIGAHEFDFKTYFNPERGLTVKCQGKIHVQEI